MIIECSVLTLERYAFTNCSLFHMPLCGLIFRDHFMQVVLIPFNGKSFLTVSFNNF